MAPVEPRGFAPVPGGNLYYERAGTGPVLVLIHSGFLDSRMWDAQVESFGRTHTVVRYDVRGHGRSAGDRRGASDGEDLTELLSYLGVGPVFLLGNSDGARIAAEFAAGFPDRTRGLILVAGNPHDLDPTREEEERFMDTVDEREGALLERASPGHEEEAIDLILDLYAPQVSDAERERLRAITRDNYVAFMTALRQPEPEGRPPAYPVADTLRRAGIPILSLSGAYDEPALNLMMGRFAQQTPSSRHYEIPEGDRTLSVSARPAFEALVLEFLARVEGGAGWPPPAG
jgi:3-oxoadipate enol-lactonase